MITVLLACTRQTFGLIRQNLTWNDPDDPSQGRVREDLTVKQARLFKKALLDREDYFKEQDDGGTNVVVMFLQVPEATVARDDPKLKWIELLLRKWPSRSKVLGAWKRNVPYGMEIRQPEYDENGDIITTPPDGDNSWTGSVKYKVWYRGTQIYPMRKAMLLKACHDKVTYDENGNETSRTPATEIVDTVSILGHGARIIV